MQERFLPELLLFFEAFMKRGHSEEIKIYVIHEISGTRDCSINPSD